MSAADLTATTPAERAQAAGITAPGAAMRLAAALDAPLPQVYLQRIPAGNLLFPEWRLYGVRADGTSALRTRFQIFSREHEARALEQAKTSAAALYDVTDWGKIINTGRTLYPAAVAEAVTTALKTSDPAELAAKIG